MRDQHPARIIVGQIDPLEKVCPIPRIHKDGCGKTNPGKEPRHPPGGGECRSVFRAGGRHPGGLTGSISTSN
ncbi:MAG: hypothetical protein STSR0009_19420 [Methanoregula sp.]